MEIFEEQQAQGQQLADERARQVLGPEPVAAPLPRPVELTEADRAARALTRMPLSVWCEFCVATRSREDRRRAQ
eukprot:4242760-Alexandrium_andersonii.AAC.1